MSYRASFRRATVALAALALVLLAPAAAHAFKPKTQLYLANEAVFSILNSTENSVEIDGRRYEVSQDVANSIRRFPQHFRTGVVGSAAFPDIVGGWGAVQPDTRTNDGTRDDRGPGGGRSFSWEWLEHVYRSGWAEFRGCNGCAEGQKALAFAYGFMANAAGHVFGHTLINQFADGPFPLAAFSDGNSVRRAARHLVIEEYIARHTPGAPTTLGNPRAFVYDRMIEDDTAALLGRGTFIEAFARMRDKLERRRERDGERLRELRNHCLVSVGGRCRQRGPRPQDLPEVALLEARRALIALWVPAINSGLRNYPTLSYQLARALFITDVQDLIEGAQRLISTYLVSYGLDMLGVPFADQVGSLVSRLLNYIEDITKEFLVKALRDGRAAEVLAFLLANGQIGPLAINQALSFLLNPALYINSSADPVGLPGDTSARLDALMGLTRDGARFPDDPFDLSRFAAARDAVTLMKLALLDTGGLNAVLGDHGVPPRYDGGGVVPDNVMLGWTRSLAGDHQWRATSTRDGRRYGEGTFPLWQDCAARQRLFRSLFQDWENGSQNFPDAGEFPEGCHGWTVVNDEPNRFEVATGQGADGTDGVMMRLRARTLDPSVLGGQAVLGTPTGRPPSRNPQAAQLQTPSVVRVVRPQVGRVFARRHLETPAEQVSFTYDTGGEAGLAVEVLGDGRPLTTLTASGPVVLNGVGAREITFRIVGTVLTSGVGGLQTSFYGRISHFRTRTANWEGALWSNDIGTPPASGIDYGSLTEAGDRAGATFVADAGVPLNGRVEATRRYQQPVDRLDFRYDAPGGGPAVTLVVQADDRTVGTYPTGGVRDVTLTGLNARKISFYWRTDQSSTLPAPYTARITDLRATTGGTPMPSQSAPAPPPPPPTAGLDVDAPGVTGLRLRVRGRAARRTVVAGFTLEEGGAATLRLLRGARVLRATGEQEVAPGARSLRLRLGRALRRGGRVTAELAVRDAAGNLAIERRRLRIPRTRR